jgi:transposase
MADAEAICEAVRRPSMGFVPVKTADQQSALMMHRARDLLIRQRTMLVNASRGHLAEFGLIEVRACTSDKADCDCHGRDGRARIGYCPSGAEGDRQPDRRRGSRLETQVIAWHKSNPVSQRLATIPGIGPIIATAIAATVADPNIFLSGRKFAAWLGLVPRQTLPVERHVSEELAISIACSSTAHTRCSFVRSKPETGLPGARPPALYRARPTTRKCGSERQ